MEHLKEFGIKNRRKKSASVEDTRKHQDKERSVLKIVTIGRKS